MDSKKILWAFLGVLLVAFVYFISLDGMLLWDEHAYMANARNHLTHSYYTEDFRFPLLEFVVALTWTFTGESILAAQLLAVFFTLAFVFFVFMLAREFMEEKYALLASIVTGLSSQVLFWGFRVYNDVLGMLLVVMAIYFFVKALKDKKNSYKLFFFVGLLTGFVFLARYPLVLIPGIFLLYLLYKGKFREFFFSCAGAFIPFLLWVVDNVVRFKDPFYQFFAQAGIVSDYSVFESPAFLFSHFWETFSFSLLFLVGFVFYFMSAKKNEKWFLSVLSIVVLVNLVFYSFFVSLKLERYLLVFIPFIAIMLGMGTKFFYGFFKRAGAGVLVLLSLFVLMPVIVSSAYTINEMSYSAWCTRDGAVKQAVGYVKENVEAGSMIVSDTWVYYGFHANTRVVSTWTDDLEMLIYDHDTVIIIVTKHDGLDVDLTAFDESDLVELERVFADHCGQEVLIYRRT